LGKPSAIVELPCRVTLPEWLHYLDVCHQSRSKLASTAAISCCRRGYRRRNAEEVEKTASLSSIAGCFLQAYHIKVPSRTTIKFPGRSRWNSTSSPTPARSAASAARAARFHPIGLAFRWRPNGNWIEFRGLSSMSGAGECDATEIVAPPSSAMSALRRRAPSMRCGRMFAEPARRATVIAKPHALGSVCDIVVRRLLARLAFRSSALGRNIGLDEAAITSAHRLKTMRSIPFGFSPVVALPIQMEPDHDA